MSHEIATLPALRVAGFSSSGVGQGIPASWQQLAARRADWPSQELYGVGRPEGHGLYFLAGVLVPDGAAAPAGLELEELPPGRYLCHHYSGTRRGLPTIVGELFNSAVAAAGERPGDPWMFVVRYAGDVSDPAHNQIECEIYVQLA
jgi:DNA gyrase inhibitor GyrI